MERRNSAALGEIQEYKNAFELIDTKKSGSIPTAKLGEVLKSLDHEVSAEELRIHEAETDVDGVGKTTFAQFLQLMVRVTSPPDEDEGPPPFYAVPSMDVSAQINLSAQLAAAATITEAKKQELKKVFSEMDSRKDGFITFDEYKCAMSKVGRPGLTDKDLKGAFDEADVDNDGSVDFLNFLYQWAKDQSPVQHDQDCFAINGFYMNMREKFVAKGASIYYMMVEWDEKDLSWEDFRQKIVGATDPEKAVKGSLRATIFATYEELELERPTIGDNGLHASASPFEGLCERMNWAGIKLSEDPFGKALLQLGLDEKTIMEWTKDPDVEFKGKLNSIFDSLEDLDTSQSLEKVKTIGKAKGNPPSGIKNMAFVFVKPKANNEKVQKLVKDTFAASKISLVKEGEIKGEVIDKDKLIDNHYYAIAQKAVLMRPKDLNAPEQGKKKFHDVFGVTWEEALKSGLVMNAAEVCAEYQLNSKELGGYWDACKKSGKMIKFCGGFYCGKIFSKTVHVKVGGGIEIEDAEDIVAAKFEHASQQDVEEIKKQFASYDTNKNGVLCLEEFSNAMKSTMNEELGAVELKAMFDDVDRNGDGEIDIEEFMFHIRSRRAQKIDQPSTIKH